MWRPHVSGLYLTTGGGCSKPEYVTHKKLNAKGELNSPTCQLLTGQKAGAIPKQFYIPALPTLAQVSLNVCSGIRDHIGDCLWPNTERCSKPTAALLGAYRVEYHQRQAIHNVLPLTTGPGLWSNNVQNQASTHQQPRGLPRPHLWSLGTTNKD